MSKDTKIRQLTFLKQYYFAVMYARKKQQTIAQPQLFKALSLIITHYSKMPVKSHLFNYNLNLSIILGLTLHDLENSLKISLGTLQKSILNKQHKNKPLFCLISIEHFYLIEDDHAFLQEIKNCQVVYEDGRSKNNILEGLQLQRSLMSNSIKAVIIPMQTKPSKKYKNPSIPNQIQQKLPIFQQKHPNFLQKKLQFDFLKGQTQFNTDQQASLNLSVPSTNCETQNTSIKSIKPHPKIQEAKLTAICQEMEQYLSIAEIFHGHVNLSVCLFNFVDYLQYNLEKGLSEEQIGEMIMLNHLMMSDYQNGAQSIINEQISHIDRPDIPDNAQFYTLKQRASKITHRELLEQQQRQLRLQYHTKQSSLVLVLPNLLDYYKEEKQFLKNIQKKFHQIAHIYKVAHGNDALVIWVTYQGLPILQELPSFRQIKKKHPKFVQKTEKFMIEEKNDLGFLKLRVRQQYKHQKEELISCQKLYKDNQSEDSWKSSTDNHSQKKKRNQEQCTIFLINFHKKCPLNLSDSQSEHSQCLISLFLEITQFFLKKITMKSKQESELNKMSNLLRISEILSITCPPISSSDEQTSKQLYDKILLDKFFYDCL